MPDMSTNGNYGQYFAQPPHPGVWTLGAQGLPTGFEPQGIGQFSQGQFGQIGTSAQQQLAAQQQIAAVQQQSAAQQQVAAQQQQVAAQQQQIAAQQQQCAHALQQLANQAALQGIGGQQTAAALQQLAQQVAAQSVVSQQVAALLSQIAQQCAQQAQSAFASSGFGVQGQQGINPQAAWALAQLANQGPAQSRYGSVYSQQPYAGNFGSYFGPQAQPWGFSRALA